MTTELVKIEGQLQQQQRTWLVTGVAGFIGSNLCEFLLKNNQMVVGLDNFSTGFQHNLDKIKDSVNESYSNFKFIEGDIRNFDTCMKALEGVEHVLHQAALGSVPRSIEHPDLSHASNVDGTFNMLNAARQLGIKSFVFASSSSVYGDNELSPKVEIHIGEQLSPYAVTKHVCELYGKVFFKTYGLKTIGIRYFNVFGKRQNPAGAYAAVIPKWIEKVINNEDIEIYGDGLTSRDFCYIENVIQANIRAALNTDDKNFGKIYNCALNSTTSLNDLSKHIIKNVEKEMGKQYEGTVHYKDFRKGDIRNSQANINEISERLNYKPDVFIEEGLERTVRFYINDK